MTLGLFATVFSLTVVETVVITQGNRAERRAIRPGGRLADSFKAASWATLLEWVLLLGIILIVSEDRWLGIPAGLGAFVGTLGSTEYSRRKLNRRRKRRQTQEP